MAWEINKTSKLAKKKQNKNKNKKNSGNTETFKDFIPKEWGDGLQWKSSY